MTRRAAQCWLDACEDGLPDLESWGRAHFDTLLHASVVFNVYIGETVDLRLAGEYFATRFGRLPTGADWLKETFVAHRQQRLVRYSAVAQGAIGLARRRMIVPRELKPRVIEELMLPFKPEADGAVPVLVHNDGRPQNVEQLHEADFAEVARLANEFHLIAVR